MCFCESHAVYFLQYFLEVENEGYIKYYLLLIKSYFWNIFQVHYPDIIDIKLAQVTHNQHKVLIVQICETC